MSEEFGGMVMVLQDFVVFCFLVQPTTKKKWRLNYLYTYRGKVLTYLLDDLQDQVNYIDLGRKKIIYYTW